MRITKTINATGEAEIRAFLADNHKLGGDHFTDDMIRAWAEDAEFQLGEGNPASIEIPARDSVSGATVDYTISDAGVQIEQWLDVYTVNADPATGEWLTEAVATGDEVDAAEWHTRTDTNAVHYDTYEAIIDDETGETETRAIALHWVLWVRS